MTVRHKIFYRGCGLGGPAPVRAWPGGLGDRGQLPQRVRATELVGDIGVGVKRGPGVVHRDTAQPA